ncbi:MAG: aminodeoxychorismate/anthranilate synthase component II [Candidatus Eremiobacteraeota bacterium]|nr:aminodeoxychorismate/anthranilate synthase component II [Candidatus Eremiobacteraeota bacterium]
MLKMLFVDNYDSFTYNVVHLFGGAGAHIEVVLNDDAKLEPALLKRYDALLIGPGPGNPSGAPRALQMLDAAVQGRMPVFGVCLGLQAIGEFFGGTIGHAPRLMHGKTSVISHDGTGVFEAVPNRFTATRYHSLCLLPRTLPPVLRATATSDDGVIQGVAHRELPIFAVQFHPESILSEHGEEIAANFLRLATV